MDRRNIEHVRKQINQLVKFGDLSVEIRDLLFVDLERLDSALDSAADQLDVINQIAILGFDTLPCEEDRKVIVVLPSGRRMPIDIVVRAEIVVYANRREFLDPC